MNATPTRTEERERFMDVLRGFAVLGIFIANLDFFTYYFLVQPGTTGDLLWPGWDQKMKVLHQVLIEGKFYSIFSFLFGWGLSLQLTRAEANGGAATGLIRRRLLGMLCIGFLHLLFWPGDIIFFYACLGFLLLWIWKRERKHLLRLALILVCSPILLYGLKLMWPILTFPSDQLAQIGMSLDQQLLHVNSEAEYFAVMHTQDFWTVLKSNISGMFYRYSDLLFISRIPKVLGMMVLGLWVGQTHFYKNIATHQRTLRWVILVGILIGLPANCALSYFLNQKGIYYTLKIEGLYQTIAYALGVAPLALAYIAAAMLAFQKPAFNRFASVLAPVGKMALTNYLTQTLVGLLVFLNIGLGWMEKVGPFWYTIFGILFFSIQIVWSTLWLKRFYFGPVEWLWRSFTYRKWQKMLR